MNAESRHDAQMYRLRFVVVALSLAPLACTLGRPPSVHASRPEAWIAPQPVVLGFAPEAIRAHESLRGLPPTWWVETASIAEEVLAQLEDEDEAGLPNLLIEPILAMTGTVTFDIPMSDDARVQQWVDYLTGRGSDWYARWLSRSTRYVPIFWPILEEHGVPRDLVFLCMIESGFSSKAYSWAHASGPWQFMPATGRRYGLEVGFWVDERRDFEKATHAAARYLKFLHSAFDDWHLAWSAYNAGEGRMAKAIRRSGTRDFWKLSRTWHLRRETRHYVPKLLAAAIIAKQPGKYGFGEVEYLPPLEWEVLPVSEATDLGTIAKACGEADDEQVGLLNPALRTTVTPPGRTWEVRVPRGKATKCREGLDAIPVEARKTFRYYEVKTGDTLDSIARSHRTTAEWIREFNEFQESTQVEDFDELVVPIPWAEAEHVQVLEPDPMRFRTSAYGPDGGNVVSYIVRPGDTIRRIASRHRVSVKKLRLWNGLWKSKGIRVGQRLKIHVGRGGAPSRGR